MREGVYKRRIGKGWINRIKGVSNRVSRVKEDRSNIVRERGLKREKKGIN
jgi:hypothetical protein